MGGFRGEGLAITYHVEHFEQPRAHLRQMSADEKVQSLRDGVIEFNKAKVLWEETVSLDGHPGREITIERPDDITLRKRLFAVHARMYVLYTESAEEKSFSKDAERFPSSFRLLAK